MDHKITPTEARSLQGIGSIKAKQNHMRKHLEDRQAHMIEHLEHAKTDSKEKQRFRNLQDLAQGRQGEKAKAEAEQAQQEQELLHILPEEIKQLITAGKITIDKRIKGA